MTSHNSIVDVPGILVGHAHDLEALTGCTVILCEDGAVGGVDQRGGAPGTRETDPLQPLHLVREIHAVVLAGGSAFGLDAAGGAVRYLEERGIGFETPVAKVPIVPSAILFDLGIGRPDVRPDAEMGYRACQAASADPPAEGNVGAGCGATVGKMLGFDRAMKSGIGSASMVVGGGLIVGAIVAVNAVGDVIDPVTGMIVAGARRAPEDPPTDPADGEASPFMDSLTVLRSMVGEATLDFRRESNTVIGVVATNAQLTKSGANKVAQMAHDGLARTIRPAHTMVDGDTIFALGTGEVNADVSLVGAFSAEVFARAIVRAVRAAETAGGLPAVKDVLG